MTKKELSPYKMNLPLDLKQRLEHAAIDNRRSLSAEIISRLEASFSGAGVDVSEKMLKLLDTLERMIKPLPAAKPGDTLLTSDLPLPPEKKTKP